MATKDKGNKGNKGTSPFAIEMAAMYGERVSILDESSRRIIVAALETPEEIAALERILAALADTSKAPDKYSAVEAPIAALAIAYHTGAIDGDKYYTWRHLIDVTNKLATKYFVAARPSNVSLPHEFIGTHADADFQNAPNCHAQMTNKPDKRPRSLWAFEFGVGNKLSPRHGRYTLTNKGNKLSASAVSLFGKYAPAIASKLAR